MKNDNSSTITNEFFYDLPPELIAQRPIRPRDEAHMYVLDRVTGKRILKQVKDLSDFLDSGDTVVINNTKVVPTVLMGKRQNGGQITIRLVSRKSEDVWDCAVNSPRIPQKGEVLSFGGGIIEGHVLHENQQGTGIFVSFESHGTPLFEAITKLGKYFHPLHLEPLKENESEILQTVYAEPEDSFQSPSAGLHLTDELLNSFRKKDINVVEITQHIGRLDSPELLTGDNVSKQDSLYEEWYSVSDSTADTINETKANNHKVLAIGTTVTRTLETVAVEKNKVKSGSGWTNLFIKPGFDFKIVDHLLSNFQSPQITTLILACAFGGTERVMDFYREAVEKKLRFLEYGDAAFYL